MALYGLKEIDRAIADLTQVLAQDSSRWDAHYYRARALRAKGDAQNAMTDLNKAIEMNPNYASSYVERASVYRVVGQFDLAVADLGTAMKIDPKEPEFKFEIGVTRFAMGDFAGAVPDLLATVPSANRAYATIFRYLAQARSGEAALDELNRNSTSLNSTAWPYPVMELYLGQRSSEATLTLAKTPDHRCESHFYVGQWHLLRREGAKAMSDFKTAVRMCTPTMVEYAAALAELKRSTNTGQ